jgi:hypothetical protein
MADEILVFVRDVEQNEWSTLPRSFKRQERVIRFHGRTYGLDRDDAQYLGRETIPVRVVEMNKDTFFTCPVEFLADDKGSQPNGDYLPREKMWNIIEQAKAQTPSKAVEQDFAEVEKRILVHEAQENLRIEVTPFEGKAVIRIQSPAFIKLSVPNREFVEIEIERLSAADIDLLMRGIASRVK